MFNLIMGFAQPFVAAPQPRREEVEVSAKLLVHHVEKIVALSKYAKIDLQAYIEKGVLPTAENLENFIQHLQEKEAEVGPIWNALVQESTQALECRRNLGQLAGGVNLSDVYQRVYQEAHQLAQQTATNWATYFTAQFLFSALSQSPISQYVVPFYTSEVNELTEELQEFNVDKVQRVVTTPDFVEKDTQNIDMEDRFLFGIMILTLQKIGSLTLSSNVLAGVLAASLSSPQMMQNVIQSPIFQACKAYLKRGNPGIDHMISQKTRSMQKALVKGELGVNALQEAIGNPSEAVQSMIQSTQIFFQDSAHDTQHTARRLFATSSSFFADSVANLRNLSIDNAQTTMQAQGTLSLSFGASLYDQATMGLSEIQENLRYAISGAKKQHLVTPFYYLLGIYSPEWDLIFSIFPKELTPLLLANTRSTNPELLMRAVTSGALMLSEQGESAPLWGMVLSSIVIQKTAEKFKGGRSFMDKCDRTITQFSKSLRHVVQDKEQDLTAFLQKTCGQTQKSANQLITVLKNLSIASPMLAFSLFSDNNYILKWTLCISPLHNLLSNALVEQSIIKPEEIHGESSFLSLTHNSLIYNTLCLAFLSYFNSTSMANSAAIILQIPSIKDNMTRFLTEKSASLLQSLGERHSPEWRAQVDQLSKVSTYLSLANRVIIVPVSTFFKISGFKTAVNKMLEVDLQDKAITMGAGRVFSLGKKLLQSEGVKRGILMVSRHRNIIATASNALLAYTLSRAIPEAPILNSVLEPIKNAACSAVAAQPQDEVNPERRKKAMAMIAGTFLILQTCLAVYNFYQPRFLEATLDFRSEATNTREWDDLLGFMMLHFLAVTMSRFV